MTPDVRVVRGEPDDVELAALVAGLAAGSANGAPSGGGAHHPHTTARRDAEAAAQRWREGASPLSHPLTPGSDAWRWSAR